MSFRIHGSSGHAQASSCEKTFECRTTRTNPLRCPLRIRRTLLAFADAGRHGRRMTGPPNRYRRQWSAKSRVPEPARSRASPWLCQSTLPRTQGIPRTLPSSLPCPVEEPRNPSQLALCTLGQTSPGSPLLRNAVRPQWRRWPPWQCGSTCMPDPLQGSTCALDGHQHGRNRPSLDRAAAPGEWPGARQAPEAHVAASRGRTDDRPPAGQTFPSPFPRSTPQASGQRIVLPPANSCYQYPTPPCAGFPARSHEATAPPVQTAQ
mmetsp:Transcript_58302/g.155824  ORF Transcript_58302/g.155824 Transcript_58302/m.155824 type:complete len:263 (-) Transcript_58302:920-1708(-)